MSAIRTIEPATDVRGAHSLHPVRSASRWKLMDMAFGDNLHGPRRLILEVHPPTGTGTFEKWWRYTTCSESDGIGSLSEHSLRTQEEWLAWVEKFADDLTGRELRAVKDAARTDFIEPDSWRAFRERFSATGDPWLRETPNSELSGGGPLSNKTTEAESRRPLE